MRFIPRPASRSTAPKTRRFGRLRPHLPTPSSKYHSWTHRLRQPTHQLPVDPARAGLNVASPPTAIPGQRKPTHMHQRTCLVRAATACHNKLRERAGGVPEQRRVHHETPQTSRWGLRTLSIALFYADFCWAGNVKEVLAPGQPQTG